MEKPKDLKEEGTTKSEQKRAEISGAEALAPLFEGIDLPCAGGSYDARNECK